MASCVLLRPVVHSLLVSQSVQQHTAPLSPPPGSVNPNPTRTRPCRLQTQVPEPRTDLSVAYLLYNITKAAMLHGAKLEAADPTLVARGITVAAACPGWCRVRALPL